MKQFEDWPETLNYKDLQECLDLSYGQAFVLLNQTDAPLCKPVVKRNRKIGKYALRDYLNGRVIKDEH